MRGCPLTFFSFVALDDAAPEQHRRYNEWHQLDHRPENLALPGVAWGDRWARTAECRAESNAVADQAETDYVAMYWFRDPVERSVQEWEQLGVDSFEWGRGPMITGVRRTLLAFFRPVKGYAASSSLVAPEVIPYRPNRGLHLTLTRFAEPFGLDTHGHHRWEDRVLIPELLDIPGVAGAWTFSLDRHQHNALRLRSDDPAESRGALRIRILYLDGDPIGTTRRIRDLLNGASPPPAKAHTLISTPLQTIIPWQDW
ncbi:hypothetical protein A5739_15480 [Mycobacterium colombiense]|uniref:hypothetical protein n=1 Tax=Mycobacterium colombiense TaxID=339268 RepID=UPI00096D1B24|nr:hypothetical protein [Mycobacterium colombiense]OMC29734.1 hypothetical protein A5739_15480 [Mycobacterium colombiense]